MDELFTLTIITPERTFYEGQVNFVEFTTAAGDVGIYRGHEEMTMLLSPGVLHIHEAEGTKKAALHTGFAEVEGDRVTVLAQIAEWPEEIDMNRAEERRIRAERAIQENGSDIREELSLRKALARIQAAK